VPGGCKELKLTQRMLLLRSCQQYTKGEVLHVHNFFFMSNSVQAYMTSSLYLVYLLFIKNRMILE